MQEGHLQNDPDGEDSRREYSTILWTECVGVKASLRIDAEFPACASHATLHTLLGSIQNQGSGLELSELLACEGPRGS